MVDGQVLVYSQSEGKWIPAHQTGGGGDVESVNGKTGAVVLVVSDLANDAGYITAAEAPVQVSDIPTNNNQLLNGAGYITAAEAPVQPGDTFSGDYNDLSNKPSIPSELDDLSDVNASAPSNGQFLQWSGSAWVPGAASGAPVDSVNGQTGAVVLDAGDVGALASGDNVSQLANDAGYITAAEAPVQPGDTFSGDYNDLTNKPSIPSTPEDIGAATAAQGAKADTAIQPGTVNPVYFANQAAFPDATANHGAVAHSHADGAMYFAHGGVWNKLANASDLPVNVSELNNDAGYLTTETVNNIDLSALPLLP